MAVALIENGGTRAGLVDMTKETRESLYRAIAAGREEGVGPIQIARNIRALADDGRLVQIAFLCDIYQRKVADLNLQTPYRDAPEERASAAPVRQEQAARSARKERVTVPETLPAGWLFQHRTPMAAPDA